ncbi:MAG: DUF2007 domain-containing protein [Bacteroidales bacterium]|jgi:hypothetical protein|nr:DUF2007 domain-containing protein [Bacteroidales bacterium]
METLSEKVFSGLAIDVNLVKKLLQSNGIDCYAQNRNAGENENGWAEQGFDPYVELFVTSQDRAEEATALIEQFLNTKAE